MNNFDKIIDRSSHTINRGITKISYVTFDSMLKFIHFILIDNNIIKITLGLITASQVGILTNTLVDQVLTPIIFRIISLFYNIDAKKLSEMKYTYLGIEFKTGLLTATIIKFVLIFLFAYLLSSLSDHTTLKKFISEMNLVKNTLKN